MAEEKISNGSEDVGPEELLCEIPEEEKQKKRLSMISQASAFIEGIDQAQIAGNPLRQPQKMAALAFCEWLKKSSDQDAPKGRLIMPMGLGKTYTAILLSQMTGAKTVFFTDSNSRGGSTISDFKEHEETLPEAGRRKIGQCFGKETTTEADVIVAGFGSHDKLRNEIDWKNVGLIIIDEADINALSSQRRSLISSLAEENGIAVVAMSATEEQSSGKKLQDAFPDEIMRLSMPDALPQCLKMGLMPQMKFYDVYFNSPMEVDSEEIMRQKDIPDNKVTAFIRSNAWNRMILNHYNENFSNGHREPGLVIFRNNVVVDNFIEEAEKMGIRAVAYTGDQSIEKLDELRKDFAERKIDLLVGSRLLGRGLDIPEVNVVYNSTITYSPQIFWQANGRGMRLNPKDADKTAHIITVLPEKLLEQKTGKDIEPWYQPLCHAAFFDPDYFGKTFGTRPLKPDYKPQGNMPSKKKLSLCKFDIQEIDSVRSVDEMSSILKELWDKPPDFRGRVKIISDLLESLRGEEGMSLERIYRILEILNKTTIALAAKWQGENKKNHLKAPKTKTEKMFSNVPNLSFAEERRLLQNYFEGRYSQDSALKQKSGQAREELIKAHLPLVAGIAKVWARTSGMDVEDLIQEGVLGIMKSLEGFDMARRGRLCTYFVYAIYRKIEKTIQDNNRNVRVPNYVYEISDRAEAIKHNIIHNRKSPKKIPSEITNEDLAPAIGMRPEKIQRIREVCSAIEVPWDQLLEKDPAESEAFTLAETTPGENIDVDWFELREKVRYVLSTLVPREEMIVRERFGIGHPKEEEKTLEEVGVRIQTCPETARRIEAKALRKLRHPSRKRRLAAFVDPRVLEEHRRGLASFNPLELRRP